MYKNKKILAIIPARGGSKGIPKKNIYKVEGIPLIEYTLKEAHKSKLIDTCIVSTDCPEIRSICIDLKATVTMLRPKNLATDKAKVIDVIIHELRALEINNKIYDYVILLQPTQPLRSVLDIDNSIKLTIDNNYNSVVGVSPVKEHPLLIRKINSNGELESILDIPSTVRRQEFPKYYKVNGAIYINKVETLSEKTSLNDNIHPYIMENYYDLDIDDISDLEKFKLILQGKIKI